MQLNLLLYSRITHKNTKNMLFFLFNFALEDAIKIPMDISYIKHNYRCCFIYKKKTPGHVFCVVPWYRDKYGPLGADILCFVHWNSIHIRKHTI